MGFKILRLPPSQPVAILHFSKIVVEVKTLILPHVIKLVDRSKQKQTLCNFSWTFEMNVVSQTLQFDIII